MTSVFFALFTSVISKSLFDVIDTGFKFRFQTSGVKPKAFRTSVIRDLLFADNVAHVAASLDKAQ